MKKIPTESVMLIGQLMTELAKRTRPDDGSVQKALTEMTNDQLVFLVLNAVLDLLLEADEASAEIVGYEKLQ